MKAVSKIEKFPGHVILPDYLTLPQVRAFEDALDGVRDVSGQTEGDNIWLSVVAEKRLPVIFDCVKEWHIKGIPDDPSVDTFPMTPVGAANELVAWLFGLVQTLWMGENTDPNP